MEVLEVFRENKTEIVFVIDEWGEVEGIVTLQDVFESLGGGFTPIEDEDSWSIKRQDGSWLLDGALPLADLKDCLELRTLPEEERNRYHTVSGLVLFLLGKIPSTGDLVEWEGWRLEVIDMDGKRIDKVLAQPVTATAPDPA
jgi:putative hemolysin